MTKQRISVIGLGKLGAPMAAVFANAGHTVIGVDIDRGVVAKIQAGIASVQEPELDDMIARNRDRLTATTDYERAVLETDITFIIVPTPSNDDGTFSMDFVLETAEKIGSALRGKNSWHLIVLSSTVMLGGTDRLRIMLERMSGKKCGKDFGLCYNPEFIALGSVIRDIQCPDMVLIGESDRTSGRSLADFWWTVCSNFHIVHCMNFVNAELTKLAVNTFVTTKISYANTLAQICENLPGADVDVVTGAVGCDHRIGPAYLKGALGYGGPCFPRDNAAFAEMARRNGVIPYIADATDKVNRNQVSQLYWMIKRTLPINRGTVGILGLSYKPGTPVTDESQGLKLAERLASGGFHVIVYDPIARPALSPKITVASSVWECARQADVLVITTAWPDFKSLTADNLKSNQTTVVIDCWRILKKENFAGVDYRVLGVGR